MLKDAFFDVYTKFKLHFCKEIFQRFQTREASLTTVETFCMETILALGRPTVNEFATFMCISPPPTPLIRSTASRKRATSTVFSPRQTGGNSIWK